MNYAVVIAFQLLIVVLIARKINRAEYWPEGWFRNCFNHYRWYGEFTMFAPWRGFNCRCVKIPVIIKDTVAGADECGTVVIK